MKNLTPELIAKAKAAKSAEELFEIAKANNVEMTEDEAKTYFAQLNANGTVSDDELDAVAGGGGCPNNGEESEAKPKLMPGQKVRVLGGKTCPKCHSNEGVIGYNLTATGMTGNTMYVACPKCNMEITNYVSNDNVEFI